MQKLKGNIQKNILYTAERLFLQKSFQKTSMREIASTTQVGLSNIYNYFHSKDEIFCTIVRPTVLAFETMLHEHHGYQTTDVMDICTKSYLQKITNEYITLIYTHRKALKLLFFHAHGSSLEHFREQFTDHSTVLVKNWLANMKRQYPSINIAVSDFSIHLHTVWMFTLFEEIIMHKIKPKDMPQIISEYIRFETTGWRELIRI